MRFEERHYVLGFMLAVYSPARTRPLVSLCVDFPICKMALMPLSGLLAGLIFCFHFCLFE